MKKKKLYISGMHCSSCQTAIETEVKNLDGIKKINVNLNTEDAEIEYDEKRVDLEKIKKAIANLNYKISEKPQKKAKKKGLIAIIILIILFVIGYVIIKQLGLLEVLSKLNEKNISYWLIFIIGLLASFHCVGMCGGIVVTYSTSNINNKNKSLKPHFGYNLGRLISYTTIGGVLGGFGSFFGVNPNFTGTVVLVAGILMILMGLSLFTHNKYLEKIKIKIPKFIAKYLYSNKDSKKPKGPFVIGILNGFMPCGPLQAMQLYALASGSITTGALSMGLYALGTIPLMFGLGSVISMISQQRIKQIMKISGVIVILLGMFMLNRGLTNFGYGFQGFAPSDSTSQKEFVVTGNVEEQQVINMDLSYRGYSPNVLYIKKDVPVRWVINVKQMSGCTDSIMIESLGIKKDLRLGENIIEFVPPNGVKEIKFSCWMKMVWGKFVVIDDVSQNQKQLEVEPINASQGTCSGNGSCGGGCGQSTCGCSRIK